MGNGMTYIASVVGIDGSGKSSTFRGVLAELAAQLHVTGIGEQVVTGKPGEQLRTRTDIPLTRIARISGRLAKGSRCRLLYKNLKTIELTERARAAEYIAVHEHPDLILTDGQPLINSAAWAAARFYKWALSNNDQALAEALVYMEGEKRIPLRRLPYYLLKSWQLVLLNWLRLGPLKPPDMVVFLDVDPTIALKRIRSRGQALQAHETEEFLGELGSAYARVCHLLQLRHNILVIRLRVDEMTLDETVKRVSDLALQHVKRHMVCK